MIIEKQEILPGEYQQVSLNVSRLPSGTRIYVECHVFRGVEPGPTVLVMAGVHGDEINGIESVRRTLDLGVYNNIEKGNVIVIPLLNVFGFINFSREVPDGKDVNRSFPGTSAGSLASRVASVLTKKILPHIDYAIDLHTGGASRYNYPQLRFNAGDDKALSLAKVFGAPYLIEKPKITRSFRKVATDLGKVVLVYEAGESVRLDGFSIEIAVDGIKRVLQHLGMIEKAPVRRHDMVYFKSTGWVRATEAGLFTWSKSSGSII
ncbi:MAG: putative deacylase, partial [Saprospiraceae bacterium]